MSKMLLIIFFLLIGGLALVLMSKNFYIYSNRSDPDKVGRASLISGVAFLVLALVLFISSFVMMGNNKVQYTVQFNKMVKVN